MVRSRKTKEFASQSYLQFTPLCSRNVCILYAGPRTRLLYLVFRIECQNHTSELPEGGLTNFTFRNDRDIALRCKFMMCKVFGRDHTKGVLNLFSRKSVLAEP